MESTSNPYVVEIGEDFTFQFLVIQLQMMFSSCIGMGDYKERPAMSGVGCDGVFQRH